MADRPRFEKAQGVDVGFAGAASHALTTGFTGLRRLTLRNEKAQLIWQREVSGRRSLRGGEDETPQTFLRFPLGIPEVEAVRPPDHRRPTKE